MVEQCSRYQACELCSRRDHPTLGMRSYLLQGKSGMDMYKDFEVDRDQGNFDKLPELHAVLSGMKASPAQQSPQQLYL